MTKSQQLAVERLHPTLRMVAQESGVSITTASRVINNSPHVSRAKRAAVQAAIAKLGFVPNGIAKSLVQGRSHTIGLVAQFFESPFYARLLRSVEETLSTAGYGLVVSSGHWNRREEEQCVATLRARQVDGIIVLTGALDDGFLKSLAADLPVVVTGRELHAPGLHALHSDDHQGALAATRHLLQLGHRRAGIDADPALIVRGDYREESGAQAVDVMLARGVEFTAVFAANDQMATGATQVLFRRGLRVPEDVSVVGFDDLLAAKFASPPRTSVNLCVAELGRRAALAMLDLLAGRTPAITAPEPELVVRGSTHRAPTPQHIRPQNPSH